MPDPLTLFYLSMACLVVGVVGAVVWAVYEARRDHRRAAARARRRYEIAQPHPDDWRSLVPRRWQIEGNVRYAFWHWAEQLKRVAQVLEGTGR